MGQLFPFPCAQDTQIRFVGAGAGPFRFPPFFLNKNLDRKKTWHSFPFSFFLTTKLRGITSWCIVHWFFFFLFVNKREKKTRRDFLMVMIMMMMSRTKNRARSISIENKVGWPIKRDHTSRTDVWWVPREKSKITGILPFQKRSWTENLKWVN